MATTITSIISKDSVFVVDDVQLVFPSSSVDKKSHDDSSADVKYILPNGDVEPDLNYIL